MLESDNNNFNNNISRIITNRRSPQFFENSHLNEIHFETISKFRRALPQFIAVGINNVLLFVYGMTLGFPIIIIPAIQLGKNYRNNDLFLSREHVAWLSSISLICVPLGSILSGFYSEYIGKKRALQLINIPIIISYLLFHFATNAEHLYLALGLSALSCGLIETPVLIYIAETIEPIYRGYLTASGSIFILLGIIFQQYISSILHWRMIAAISTLFPVISIILLFFIPESPVWLIYKNNLVGAIKSLKWFRGWVSDNEVEIEFLEIYNRAIKRLYSENTSAMETKCFFIFHKNKFECFKKKSLWYPFMLILFMFFIGHFSGKTTLQMYTVQIFHTLKAPLKKFEATMLLSLFDLLGNISCVVLLQFIGKRKLIFISTIGTGICFFGTGIYAYFLYKIPGYSVDNIVTYAANVPNENIITTSNITNIFNIISQNSLVNQNIIDSNESIIISEEMKFNENKNLTKFEIINEFNSQNISSTQLKYDENFLNYYNNKSNEFEFHEYKNDLDKLNGIEIKNISKTVIAEDLIKLSKLTQGQIIITVPQQETNSILWVPLVLLLGAAFFAHIGIKTIPWILIGEILPHEIRSYTAGIISGFGFFFGFIANRFFLVMLHTLTISGTFWFYAVVSVYGTIILYYILPETENKSIKDIENYFENAKSLYKNKIPSKL